jgi:hypothetical protein
MRCWGTRRDKWKAECGVVRRHHDVGVTDQTHASTQTETLDRSDDRHLALVGGGEGGEASAVGTDQGIVALGLDLFDVDPGAEPFALGPQDHDPVVGHPAGGEQRVGQPEPPGDIEGVNRGMVDDDFGDAGPLLMGDDGHGVLRVDAARPADPPGLGTVGDAATHRACGGECLFSDAAAGTDRGRPHGF